MTYLFMMLIPIWWWVSWCCAGSRRCREALRNIRAPGTPIGDLARLLSERVQPSRSLTLWRRGTAVDRGISLVFG
jgi:hypothetical protein